MRNAKRLDRRRPAEVDEGRRQGYDLHAALQFLQKVLKPVRDGLQEVGR